MGLLGLVAFAVPLAPRLSPAVRRIAAGSQPRWRATVLQDKARALTVRVVPLARSDAGPRIVRLNTLPYAEQVHAGDDLVLDGPLGRGDWVAVAGQLRTRWVTTTLRQPRRGRPARHSGGTDRFGIQIDSGSRSIRDPDRFGIQG